MKVPPAVTSSTESSSLSSMRVFFGALLNHRSSWCQPWANVRCRHLLLPSANNATLARRTCRPPGNPRHGGRRPYRRNFKKRLSSTDRRGYRRSSAIVACNLSWMFFRPDCMQCRRPPWKCRKAFIFERSRNLLMLLPGNNSVYPLAVPCMLHPSYLDQLFQSLVRSLEMEYPAD